jgi:DNA polymerase-3 subunit epsilon
MSEGPPSVTGVGQNLLAPPPGGRLDLGYAAPLDGRAVTAIQPSLDDVGLPLAETTFVVVDLETTGCSPNLSGITEIGAVKVRGGIVDGEFQTLVDPGGPVPPMITVLTGITDAMLVGAPRIEAVLPAFLEFARGAVLVAHNASFDVGFLRAAAARAGLPWSRPLVVDTVALARRVVTRDEAPNHKLSTLASLFRSTVTPNHRALDDARATVEVLHALLARMGPLGVTHLEDLLTAADPVPQARRRKAGLAEGLPNAPGAYLFLGPGEEVLYVGTAVDIRRRVRSYFTAAEKRSRMGEMLALAQSVRPVPCATVLEARVRELRLIAEHKPPYNRRSRTPEREPWLRLTDEEYPRLSVVRSVAVGTPALGPFSSRSAAEAAAAALLAAFPLRTCGARLPRRPSAGATACALAEMGRCAAPCTRGAEAPGYASAVAGARKAFAGHVEPVVAAVRRRISTLAGQERYEEAATARDQLAALLRAGARAERLHPLLACPELVAARRAEQGGWEIVLARYGRLAGTTTVPRGADPRPAVEALTAGGEHVLAPTQRCGRASAHESELIVDWLQQPGVRLVERSSNAPALASPVGGYERFLARAPRAAR